MIRVNGLAVSRRLWHSGDGTKFAYIRRRRRGWWILYCGWVQVEFFRRRAEQ